MNIISRYTVKSLKKNKIRTLVTIIGIILSVAMFTAVTESIASGQKFIENITAENVGVFHAFFKNFTSDEVKALQEDSEIDQVVTRQNIGYALFGSSNEDKPYLFIGGMSEGFDQLVSIHPKEGRLPQNNRELLIPEHVYTIGGVNLKVGDQLTLEVGNLMDDDGLVMQGGNFHTSTLENTRTVTYTVVGIYARPDSLIEDSLSGYTALTLEDADGTDHYTAYFTLKKVGNAYKYQAAHHYDDSEIRFNSDFLYSQFVTNDISYATMIGGFMAILMGLIMFGSIALIYNSFSISVSERTKQFGLLKSIGATKKQILHSVLFEAIVLCLVGIPLGLLSGCVGIGVTFWLLRDTFSVFLNTGEVVLKLSVAPWALILAAIVSIVTVLISAYIPARRAVRINTIDAIKQSKDINIKAKQVKTSKLTYKLFGFPGTLASKNFKRSKKKYKSTVVSLSLSVLLFVSASSFTNNLLLSANNVDTSTSFDIVYYENSSDFTKLREQIPQISQKLSSAAYVTGSSYFYTVNDSIDWQINASLLTGNQSDFFNQTDDPSTVSFVDLNVLFIDDYTYESWLGQLGLNAQKFMDKENPIGLFDNRAYYYEGFKLQETNLLKEEISDFALTYYIPKAIEGYHYADIVYDSDGANDFYYLYVLDDVYQNGYSRDDLNESNSLKLSKEDAMEKLTVAVGGYLIGDSLLGIRGPSLYFPASAAEHLLKMNNFNTTAFIYLNSDRHNESYAEMCELLQNEGIPTSRLSDYAASQETVRALITVITVFSYGFIVLISLIALANVFNTISTNFLLRRREFAMLKSVGMTGREFRRMLNFECIMYGIKGLIYGLSGSLLICFLIYTVAQNSGEVQFTLPWLSILIAVISVFAVVFSTMIYQRQRMKKENLIDTLKNETI